MRGTYDHAYVDRPLFTVSVTVKHVHVSFKLSRIHMSSCYKRLYSYAFFHMSSFICLRSTNYNSEGREYGGGHVAVALQRLYQGLVHVCVYM
jgi:hypothetical protein